ncbi:hypothetical protein Pst134EA_033034 [Puccinia striiformis f. sp. tritici]|uniref:hypothetical protein n=1 Tax=Puccinia striiformis f. sp. tritici TaxID=168172 RepID=UPI002007AD28|nr:hypothetical protein Pst134EA_033034 [Puccinia striiformis f. sp. tritici]KAH9459547.1 hypothetical protein Pst134EA_033034 [Puccinia striiformis f. sp. tritici]
MTTEELRSRILLNPNNYIPWLFAMEAKLIGIEALEIVTGATPAPAEQAANKKGDYYKINRKAYLLIVDYHTSDVMNYASASLPERDRHSGYGLWQLLQNKYAGTDLAARSVAVEYFLRPKLSTLSIFISDMQTANQKLVLSGLTLDDQFKTLMMLDKLPISFNSFRDIISMGFATESFDRILRKLKNYGIQNKIDSIVDSEVLKSPVTSMYTRSINSDVSCPHCKRSFRLCTHCGKTGHTEPNCYAKNNPSGHQAKSVGLTSKHQHSSNMVMTEEDEDAINAIYDRYPDLRL